MRPQQILLLLTLALPWSSFAIAQSEIPLSELKVGGLPKGIATINLKSGKPILVITRTTSRSRSIIKMLDYESGQPVTFSAKKVAISSVENEPPSTALFKRLLQDTYSFLIVVHPIRDGKYIGSESRRIIVVSSKAARDTTSPEIRLENAYRNLLGDAKRLLIYQNRKVKPLSFELADVGNSWVKFSKKEELKRTLDFLAAGRQRIESLDIKLQIESIGLLVDDRKETAETSFLSKEVDAYVKELKLYDGLHTEVKRKFQLAREFQQEAVQLSRAIDRFQSDQREKRNEELNSMLTELELLSAKADVMYAEHAFALQALAVQHSIEEQELEEYRSWLEAEEEAAAAQVADSYYNDSGSGGDWDNFQLMHQTSRMQFNMFYGDNWNHRPATDGRQ